MHLLFSLAVLGSSTHLHHIPLRQRQPRVFAPPASLLGFGFVWTALPWRERDGICQVLVKYTSSLCLTVPRHPQHPSWNQLRHGYINGRSRRLATLHCQGFEALGTGFSQGMSQEPESMFPSLHAVLTRTASFVPSGGRRPD